MNEPKSAGPEVGGYQNKIFVIWMHWGTKSIAKRAWSNSTVPLDL